MLGKIKGKRRRGQQRMRWLDGIIDSMDMKVKVKVPQLCPTLCDLMDSTVRGNCLLQHMVFSFVAACRLSSCGPQALEHLGLVALWHVES